MARKSIKRVLSPVWKPAVGETLIGTITDRGPEISTVHGTAATVLFTVAPRTEASVIQHGDIDTVKGPCEILIILSTVLGNLRDHVGKKVEIVCLGKPQGKSYIDYDVFEIDSF